MPPAAPEAGPDARHRKPSSSPVVSRGRSRTAAARPSRTGPLRRSLWRRWLPLGVVVAVAAVCAGVYVVDEITYSELDSPSLLAAIPPAPDGPVVMAPAGGNGSPSTTPEPEPTTEAPPPTTEAEEEETEEAEPAQETEEPPAPAQRARSGSAPGGLPWHSGLVVGVPRQIAAWEDYRGREVDVVHAFSDRSSWNGLEEAGWILGYYADTPDLLVISQPFWPEDSGGSLGACADGAYNQHWATYGRNLVEAGRADAYTRLAWEFNGDWFEWSATDVGAWISCFREVVGAVRSTNPDARFEWNMNAHGSQTCDGNAWNCYPGDEYVDVVGIDPYDHFPASRSSDQFDAQCHEQEGLCTVIEFAREHGKEVGVTEWGVINSGAGDNPLYIEKMFETFEAAADVMAYETYFNEEDYGNALHDPNQNPQSSEVYRNLFGG